MFRTFADMRSIKYFGVIAILGVLLAAALLGVRRDAPESPEEASAAEEAAPAQAAEDRGDKYGLISDGYEIIDRSVRRGETFGGILTEHNVPYAQVISVSETGKDVFDVRGIKAGKPLRIYRESRGGAAQARYVVYEQDLLNYVVFDLAADSASSPVYAVEREKEIKRERISGRIAGSLYETLGSLYQSLDSLAQNRKTAAPRLTQRLEEMFAWQIDFFRIFPDDEFNVIYDAAYVDGTLYDIEQIVAARFGHRSTNYFGFWFEEGESPDFYDERGQGLRRALRKAPLESYRISSGYSKRRFHPIQKRYKAHLGTDYAAPRGTPILAAGDGTVLEAQFKKYNGNYVTIRHNSVYKTGYLHMSRIARGIRPGARVRQGDVIGYVGSTGLATGPHVCYRYWKNGVQIDPRTDTLPPVKAIPPELMDRFEALRDELMPQIDEDRPTLLADSEARKAGTPS